MQVTKGFPSIHSTCPYVPKIFFLSFSLMCNVPSVSLRSKISFMDKYFPMDIMFPLSIFVPFFKASSIFIAKQTDSVKLLNTGNSSMCHRLTCSSLEFWKNIFITKKEIKWWWSTNLLDHKKPNHFVKNTSLKKVILDFVIRTSDVTVSKHMLIQGCYSSTMAS